MRIGEIAEKTGLTISNIRFYEKKGLIGPDRDQESKYRNYSEEDLQTLEKIILYRKMGISIESISDILSNKTDLKEVIETQIQNLKLQQEMLQGSIDLCEKIIADDINTDFDAQFYLNYVKQEEIKGNRFAQIDEMLDNFSDVTNLSRFIGGKSVGWYLVPIPWVNRLLIILFGLILLSIPILLIINIIL